MSHVIRTPFHHLNEDWDSPDQRKIWGVGFTWWGPYVFEIWVTLYQPKAQKGHWSIKSSYQLDPLLRGRERRVWLPSYVSFCLHKTGTGIPTPPYGHEHWILNCGRQCEVISQRKTRISDKNNRLMYQCMYVLWYIQVRKEVERIRWWYSEWIQVYQTI